VRSLKAPYKDWRRRRALERGGVRPDVAVPEAIALGERSGTWVFDPHGLGEHSVVYSGGVGDNIAWDLALIERFGVTVHAFDPTPRSVAWLARQELPAGYVHHARGLAGADGERRFAAPAKDRSANFTLAAGGEGASGARSDTAPLPVARLATVARELGHARIDLLKLDIEGAEYEVLADALEDGPPFDQLLVEFHHGEGPWRLEHTLRAVAALRANGLRLFHVSRRGLELSFVRA
jgi:FkbM family methyltransferase